MPEFSDILVDLRAGLDDPDAFRMQMRADVDPYLVDRLSAFGASRGLSFPETVLRALEMFMLSVAEEAWQKISEDAEPDVPLGGAALNPVLEQFLTANLDVARQGQLEGPPPATHTLFRRMT